MVAPWSDLMTKTQSWLRCGRLTLAAFGCLGLASAYLWAAPPPRHQQAARPEVAVPAGAQADEAAFRDLLQRYYTAVARKDVEALEAVWHSGAPARSQRNLLVVGFELRDGGL